MNALTTFFSLTLVLPVAARGSQEGPAVARQATLSAPAAPNAQEAPAAAAQSTSFSTEQLEQIVAPIALYPDALLAQLMIAATYPLEIVEAARWQKSHASKKGDELEKALQGQTWDPSVKSLCGFPDVLKRMNENLDWTQDLGDAFLGQREEVMKAVQAMRRKAYDAGNLKSSKELTVKEEADQIIVIQAADPEVIYVPTYYPTAVYGSWGYPYYYYPPMYPPPPAGGAWFGFSVGVIWGAAIWGDCDWHGNDVNIDIDHHNTFVDRTETGDRRQQAKDKAATNKGKWQHDPAHRKGVGYKDNKVAQQYGARAGQARVTRDQARGYSSRPGGGNAPSQRPAAGTGAVQRPGGGTVPAQRPAAGAGTTPSNRATTRPSTGQSGGSFTGSGSASSTRASSSRGGASRGSGGARGGGGGRGGGGRR